LVVLPNGGFVEDLPHKMAKVEALLGGVCCKVVLGLLYGLSDARLLLRLVVDMTSAECKHTARTGLTRRAVTCSIAVREAWKVETMVAPHPPKR
jgi:hypothetical protein